MNMNETVETCILPSVPMPGMGMFFHFSNCERLLFYSWEIRTVGELIGAVIAVFMMAVFYEGLKTFRELLLYWDLSRFKPKKTRCSGATEMRTKGDYKPVITINDDFNDEQPSTSKIKTYTISLTMHSIQSALHVFQIGYGYILMLVAMTFNVWLFLSVCFGAGVGYFLFSRTRHILGISERERNEHCH